MRWFWIDRFTEFVSGDRAVAVKNVSLAEEQLHGYFDGFPIMPQSLILEGMAQTGGMLVGESTKYEARLVLAKVAKIQYHAVARPGDVLTYSAVMTSPVNESGARLETKSHIGDTLQAEAELILGILPQRHEAEELFQPAAFAKLLRLLRVYEVGLDAEGNTLQMPDRLLAAEQDASLSNPLA
jgi:3-hydroxyacyl-[acyl-carrier-protein] dehydratase